MVMPPPPPPAPWARRRRRRWPFLLIPPLAVVLLVTLASSFTLPYYAIAPGEARQVNDLIRVPTERAFPPNGKVLLATVSLGPATPLEALIGWVDSDVDLVSEDEVLGPIPQKEFSRYNRELMNSSQQAAIVVALRRLGFQVPEHGRGGLIARVETGSPADGHLEVGEVIVAVDGRPAQVASEVVAVIRAHKAGDRIRLDIEGRDGVRRSEHVVLASHPERPAGFLGVSLITKDQRFDFPFEISIGSTGIGGPSAGLAFTLGVLDFLTAGELTGGKTVAATGTMELDGTVGNVGGVAQKVKAVRSAGVDYFLVPPDEYDEALAGAGSSLKVMKVANLSEAMHALVKLGGDVSVVGSPSRPSLR
jgi:PDZ domain-containing protein